MSDWREATRTLAGTPTALITILATEGSAPRGPGTRMLVTARGQAGTIGGGAHEWRVEEFPLGPLLGHCCGGRGRLLVEHLADTDWIAALAEGAVVHATLRDGH